MPHPADFHHPGATPGVPYPDGLLEPAAAFDATVDMVDAHQSPSDLPIPSLLRARQLLAAGLLRRLEDVHAVPRACLPAQVWPPLAPCRPWRRRGGDAPLVMDTLGRRLTAEQPAPGPRDQEEGLPQVPLVLAALARCLCSRVLGARDGSLGTVLTNRGATQGGSLPLCHG